ncbi:hypothetical protein L1887_15027 [Cichorium endivia]|nr:hypothetical protein L1887_15027 [Cichorium endivia]
MPIPTTAREFFSSSSNYVAAKCVSSFSSSSSSSPSVSVADTVEWDEHTLSAEVEDSGDDFVSDEDVKSSIPIRAYFVSTSVDLKSLVLDECSLFSTPTPAETTPHHRLFNQMVELVLEEKDVGVWIYRGEGGLNIVLAYSWSSPNFV